MKHILKSVVATLLAILARAIIRKYNPTIVMVTGSVGKTSTKDAVASALYGRFLLRASEKSYNSEFGVPLTIIGAKNPWENPSAWVQVLQEALALIMLPNQYPRLLVLEVGADRPGDLRRILSIATPDAVVVTKLPEIPVHVEAYASPSAVREEEFLPACALAAGAPLIISADDPYAKVMAGRLSANVITVGYAEDAFVRIENPHFTGTGMEATLVDCGTHRTIRAKGALGRPQMYAPAMAYALALALHLKPEEILTNLEGYLPPPGRARVLKGIHGSVLIDDSYNASPTAVEEALHGMRMIPGSRRIVALGDMLELGRYSMEEHERIGALVATSSDMIVTVGPRSKDALESAREHGLTHEAALGFETSVEAGHALAGIVKEGDVILIKGSQSMRMERIVEALLADPMDARLLVRQDTEWKRR